MFIKRKSANLFKKSATLSLMKLKNAALEAAKAHTEEKAETPKKNRKASTNIATGDADKQ
jgi:hypothetical protein